jgi:Fic family protein
MTWNWQQNDWPNFRYNKDLPAEAESQFLYKTGIIAGSQKHLNISEEKDLIITLVSEEALKTSEIEGEYLSRDSLQSSIKRHFGISTDNRKVTLAESGIAEMMMDLYTTYNEPLSHENLFRWHKMLTNGRTDLQDIGRYRTFIEPMQIVSGKLYDPKVHFEAPRSCDIEKEMDQYISWYNSSTGSDHPLTRAAIAHLYFESIHPFEDGNGRIGRALTIKALSQSIKQPILIGLSTIINKKKKDYYTALERNNKSMEISDWLSYFTGTILEAQEYSLNLIDFLIAKAKFYGKHQGDFNPRQEKAVSRIFAEGIDGFEGGMSADKYISVTKASKATATRDLSHLVLIGALTKTGILKGTRYYLNLNL